MARYEIKFPNGSTQSIASRSRRKVTHAVVIKVKREWSVWSGHGDSRSAYGEAASLIEIGAKFDEVTVVPVTKLATFRRQTGDAKLSEPMIKALRYLDAAERDDRAYLARTSYPRQMTNTTVALIDRGLVAVAKTAKVVHPLTDKGRRVLAELEG